MGSIAQAINALDVGTSGKQALLTLLGGKGYISLPLNSFRETTNFDVANIAGNGGVLASDTTPILAAVNDATDGQQTLVWAASNNDQIVASLYLPKDLDYDKPIKLYTTIVSGGTTDAVGFTVDSFFDIGDTKVVDTSGTNQTTTAAEVTATIAASDIPSGATMLTIGLTPVAHTTDTLTAYGGVLIEYTKSLTADISR